MVLALAVSCTFAQAQTGVVMAAPKFVAYDNSGDPLASGRLYTYQCGTTTALTTYSDSALSVANANPTVLDSAGRATVYVPAGLCVKYVLKTSADVTLWTQDNVTSGQTPVDHARCDGRLTLTSGTPVTTSDVSNATTLYWTPFRGNQCALYNATLAYWARYTFTERSLTLVGLTASTPYDIFLYDNAGTLTLEATAWSSATARATAITTQDGVYVKSGATTRRYLGTIYIDGVGGRTQDTTALRYVWNYYNRVPRILNRLESTASWTYTTATIRQANGSAANQVDLVVGVAEAGLNLSLIVSTVNTNANVERSVGFGEDSTTAMATGSVSGDTAPAAAAVASAVASLVKTPAIGRHYYTWLENSTATGTTTWYGDRTGTVNMIRSGITGWIEG